MQSVEARITQDVFEVLSVQNSVKSRTSYGGTAPKNVGAGAGLGQAACAALSAACDAARGKCRNSGAGGGQKDGQEVGLRLAIGGRSCMVRAILIEIWAPPQAGARER